MDDAQPKDVVEDPHAACQQQVTDAEAKWKRALADYQNREKELAREREDFAKFCTVGLLRDALPLGDALRAAGEGHAELLKLFADFLKRHGVESIGVVGDRVDYLLHEVVGTRLPSGASAQEGAENIVPGTILEVAQVGYTMHGRLLRPARVIVAE
ncbi:MAG: nucleotide exchange factor GrpE [bacterium]|nr:nucleotide exchange factor GrpE [bacterium]